MVGAAVRLRHAVVHPEPWSSQCRTRPGFPRCTARTSTGGRDWGARRRTLARTTGRVKSGMGRSGNLCESSLILVGCVNSRAQNPVDVARTDVRFSVARVVEGDARTGTVIALQVSHGEGGGVSGSPYLYQDACYTLYLHATDQPFRQLADDRSRRRARKGPARCLRRRYRQRGRGDRRDPSPGGRDGGAVRTDAGTKRGLAPGPRGLYRHRRVIGTCRARTVS